jgi:hypothetical protein
MNDHRTVVAETDQSSETLATERASFRRRCYVFMNEWSKDRAGEAPTLQPALSEVGLHIPGFSGFGAPWHLLTPVRCGVRSCRSPGRARPW